MANDDHIAQLKKGVAAWNAWKSNSAAVEAQQHAKVGITKFGTLFLFDGACFPKRPSTDAPSEHWRRLSSMHVRGRPKEPWR
jgi:hypothetical protein